MNRNRMFFICMLIMLYITTGCTVIINKTTVEMNVKQGTKDLPNGSGYFDFGKIPVNTLTPTVSFTIENNGLDDLILTNWPRVRLTGTHASEFTVNSSLIAPSIAPGKSTVFTITFNPTSLGVKYATVSIGNNDKNRNPYTFVVKGTGTAPAPEIHVMQDQTDILSPTGLYNFGFFPVFSESDKVTFTIYNNGNRELLLTGGTNKIQMSGSDANMFSIFQLSVPDKIPVGGSASFEISFHPTSKAKFSATILILSNDLDENPYSFKVEGNGYEIPEINVKQGSEYIPSGTGKYDFGNIPVGEPSQSKVFTIENNGTSVLVLFDAYPVKISGTDQSLFSIKQNNTDKQIAPGSSTTFEIVFTPDSTGLKTAHISIANNNTEVNPYTFDIEGTGTVTEINVKRGSDNIPNTTGTFNMGNGLINMTGPQIEFTIENQGLAPLKLDGSKIVELTGTNADQFVLNTSQTTSPVAPGGSTTFKIALKPTSLGLKTATVSIENNDSDEDPYTFTITGTGSDYVEGDVNGDSYPDVIVGASSDDDGGNDSGCAYIFFGKQNWNPIIDASNADVKLVGEDGNDHFGISTAFAGDVNSDGIGDIIIGANYADISGVSAGAAYIFFGRTSWSSTIDASNADVKLTGIATADNFGFDVSTTGDINNDGKTDVIVGAYGNDDGGSSAGAAYIFFGRTSWSNTISATAADVKLVGENYTDFFGVTVSKAGDVNNDGMDDVIVGAYSADNNGSASGCAYIFFGRSSWASTIDGSGASVRIAGETAGDYLGYCVSWAGDVNKDGIDDIIVGAHAGDYGGTYSGCAYILFGRNSWSSTLTAGSADVKIIGGSANDYFGRAVSHAGDLNNDGIDDVIIGAYYDDDGGSSSGCAFILFGRTSWASSIQSSNADVKLIGEDEFDLFGYPLACYGDVNGDGYSDVLATALSDDDGGSMSGVCFIFFGKQNMSSTIDASQADVKLVGSDMGDSFGRMH